MSQSHFLMHSNTLSNSVCVYTSVYLMYLYTFTKVLIFILIHSRCNIRNRMCQTHLKKNYKIYRILFPPLFQLFFIIIKTNSNKYFLKV